MELNSVQFKDYLSDRLTDPYFILFLIIFGTGLALRLNNLGADPLWKAETYNTWAARNFFLGNGFSDPVGAENPYIRAWMTSSLPIAASFALLGFNEFAARLPSVILGLGTSVVLYYLGKDLSGRKMGLIVSGLFLTDLVAVTWHTQARMYAQSQFLYTLTIFLLLKWYSTDNLAIRSKYLFMILPAALLGFHNHISYIGIGPVFIAFLILSFLDEIKLKDIKGSLQDEFVQKHILFIISGMLVAVGFVLVNGIPAWFFGYTPEWYIQSRGSLFYLKWLLVHSKLVFFFGMGLPLVWKRKKLWLPALAFVIPFLVQSLLIEFKEPRMIFHLYPFFIVISAVPVNQALDYIERFFDYGKKNYSLFAVISIIIFLFAVQQPLDTYHRISKDPNGVIGKKPDHRAPVNYIQKRRTDKDLIISTAPFVTSWYLGNPEKIDYDLNALNYQNVSGKIISPRLGIQGIQGPQQMRRIMKNNSGWIIADSNFKKKTPKRIREVIRRRAIKIKKSSWEEIRIYRFS
ncbi:MAG: ArnT family glycosyltransferase [Candidatus Nanosalina sp.]